MDFVYRETDYGHLYQIAKTVPPLYKYYDCIVEKCPGRISVCHNEEKQINKKMILENHNHEVGDIPPVLIKERKFKTMIVAMASNPSFDNLKPSAIIANAMRSVGEFLYDSQQAKSFYKSILNKRSRRATNADPVAAQK